ncbi:MAG TPA: DNA polymerase IV [bacterium]|nr:DNA polymerase IV [bacterium]
MRAGRTIAHVDMDAFYASIEVRDTPSLRGRPVIVGAPPDARGVVAAASYEARRYGVHSAMPAREAGARCPNAVFLPVNMDKYRAVSAELFDLLGTFTPQIEPLSIDEAFLDLTGCPVPIDAPPSAGPRDDPGLAIAGAIKARIHRVLGLPVSLGVAPNKFLAKLASELAKPDGLRRVYPGKVQSTLDPLPVTALWGVGEEMRQRLAALGVSTVGALRRTPTSVLRAAVGSSAEHLAQLSRGLDDRQVVTSQDAKSIGRETTFDHDTAAPDTLGRVLAELAEDVARRLRADGVLAATVTLKVRYADFRTITRATTLAWPTDAGADLRDVVSPMWERLQPLERPVRLLGVTASRLSRTASKQLLLFGSGDQRERVDRVVDAINTRFGGGTVRQARLVDPGD